MILDKNNEFADGASLIGTAGAAFVLGAVMDLGAKPTLQDIGTGEDLHLIVQIDTAVEASGGASNATFKLVSSTTEDLATSPTTHFSTGAIAKGTLVAGYQVCSACLPSGSYKRYLGVTVTPDTNGITAGKANAFLTHDPAAYLAYPDAL